MGNGYKTFMKRMGARIKKRRKEMNMSVEEVVEKLNKPLTEEEQEAIDKMQKDFGNTVRQMREEKGWSVEEVAKRAKVPIASVQLLEAGVGDETVETTFLIVKALKGKVEMVKKGKRK
jgi:transcriptional regulator with XRE-family HTH domain